MRIDLVIAEVGLRAASTVLGALTHPLNGRYSLWLRKMSSLTLQTNAFSSVESRNSNEPSLGTDPADERFALSGSKRTFAGMKARPARSVRCVSVAAGMVFVSSGYTSFGEMPGAVPITYKPKE